MITVRPTRPEDLPALGDLFAARFGRPLSPEEWDWKYRRLPGEGRSVVACDGAGAVVAHAGAIATPARWQEGEGLLWQLVDFVGAAAGSGMRPPVVRAGRHLLAELPRDQDVPWCYGFPSERHFGLGERVFGYRPGAVVQPRAGALPAASLSDAGAEPQERAGRWAEGAWEACGGLGVRRSAELLNWRYHDRPDRYYRYYRLSAEDAVGLAVAAFVEREAWLAELWLPPGPRWEPALRAMADDLRGAGLARWRAWPNPAGIGELLERLGLTPDGEPLRLGFRTRSGDDPARRALELTYVMGDYDLV